MRYFVTIGERTFEVDLHDGEITIDGTPVAAELAAVQGTPIRHLLADGRSYALAAQSGEQRGAWEIHLDGSRAEVEVVDERTRTIQAMTGKTAAQQGPKPVRAPMPGLVLRIEVEPGLEVKPGQPVATIEAMKMENELRAEAGGVVSRVLVQQGQAVEKGMVLIEFEN
jgi:biotin carboxyl carrier protein